MEKSRKNDPKDDRMDKDKIKQSTTKKSGKKEKADKNYRPAHSDEQIGDGSAGIGGTSAI